MAWWFHPFRRALAETWGGRGDKGHGSFKLYLQLVNTFNPNSMKKTSLLSVFKAGDSTTNLHTALDMYREHVVKAQGMNIRFNSN